MLKVVILEGAWQNFLDYMNLTPPKKKTQTIKYLSDSTLFCVLVKGTKKKKKGHSTINVSD